MTAEELFSRLAPVLAPMLEARWNRRDLCVLSTRIVIDVAEYFGIEVTPVPVQTVAYNAPFAKHVANNFEGVDVKDVKSWGDDSYSVGIGFEGVKEERGRWNGHLIAAANGCFGDFAISQVERPQWNLITGKAIVGPIHLPKWRCIHEATGTVVEYRQSGDEGYRSGPDWHDRARRRHMVGALIRQARQVL